MFDNMYEVKEVTINERAEYALRLTEDCYSDKWFKFGKVEFVENESEDNASLKFEYDILEGKEFDTLLEQYKFEGKIGDLLLHFIEMGLKDNNLVYKGGVDAD